MAHAPTNREPRNSAGTVRTRLQRQICRIGLTLSRHQLEQVMTSDDSYRHTATHYRKPMNFVLEHQRQCKFYRIVFRKCNHVGSHNLTDGHFLGSLVKTFDPFLRHPLAEYLRQLQG
jgi:hypothetical protein